MDRCPSAPRGLALALAGALLTVLAGCEPPVGPTDAELVSSYRVSPTFNAFTGPCRIEYTLDGPAVVTVRVTADDPASGGRLLVHQVTEEAMETSGRRTHAWRGTGTNGLFAPQGPYHVELYARRAGSDRLESWELVTIMYRS